MPTWVSVAAMRIAPMSFLVTPPRRHNNGNIHLGSALLRRPTFSLNQTESSNPARWSSRGRSRLPSSSRSSACGILARCTRTKAAAMSSADIVSSNFAPRARSSSSTSTGVNSVSSRRSWSLARISAAVGTFIQSASIFAPRSMDSTRLRR